MDLPQLRLGGFEGSVVFVFVWSIVLVFHAAFSSLAAHRAQELANESPRDLKQRGWRFFGPLVSWITKAWRFGGIATINERKTATADAPTTASTTLFECAETEFNVRAVKAIREEAGDYRPPWWYSPTLGTLFAFGSDVPMLYETDIFSTDRWSFKVDWYPRKPPLPASITAPAEGKEIKIVVFFPGLGLGSGNKFAKNFALTMSARGYFIAIVGARGVDLPLKSSRFWHPSQCDDALTVLRYINCTYGALAHSPLSTSSPSSSFFHTCCSNRGRRRRRHDFSSTSFPPSLASFPSLAGLLDASETASDAHARGPHTSPAAPAPVQVFLVGFSAGTNIVHKTLLHLARVKAHLNPPATPTSAYDSCCENGGAPANAYGGRTRSLSRAELRTQTEQVQSGVQDAQLEGLSVRGALCCCVNYDYLAARDRLESSFIGSLYSFMMAHIYKDIVLKNGHVHEEYERGSAHLHSVLFTCTYLSDYDKLAGSFLHGFESEAHLGAALSMFDLDLSALPCPLLALQPRDDPLHQGCVRENIPVDQLTKDPNLVYMEPAFGNHFGFYEGSLLDAFTNRSSYTYPARVALAFFEQILIDEHTHTQHGHTHG